MDRPRIETTKNSGAGHKKRDGKLALPPLRAFKHQLGIVMQVTRKEFEACQGHHFPNFCDCYVYQLQQEILQLLRLVYPTNTVEISMSRFSYVKYDGLAMKAQQDLKEAFESVEKLVDRLPDGRAKSLVYTKLEEAYMWTGKSIRDDQIARNLSTDEQPERRNG